MFCDSPRQMGISLAMRDLLKEFSHLNMRTRKQITYAKRC